MREDNSHLRIVLIEDDDEDFLIIRDLLSEMTPMKFELEWITDYDTGLAAISNTPFDVCLLDYRLGDRDGLEFLRKKALCSSNSSSDKSYPTPYRLRTPSVS